jgi:hypothetical protein
MVNKDVIQYYKGKFTLETYKLNSLAKSTSTFDFAMKSLLWFLCTVEYNEMLGIIMDGVDDFDAQNTNTPWHTLLKKYRDVYNDAKQYCVHIMEEIGIDVSGMFTATVDVRVLPGGLFKFNNPHVVTESMKKMPKNRALEPYEQQLKDKAEMVKAMMEAKLVEVNKDRAQQDPPLEPFVWLDWDTEREILDKYWRPYFKGFFIERQWIDLVPYTSRQV